MPGRTLDKGDKPSRRWPWRRALAALVVVAGALALPVPTLADEVFGGPLTGDPTVTKSSTADSVYWDPSAASPDAAQVTSVMIKGYWNGSGSSKIAFQVLRPQPDGSLLVVATSQLFDLPTQPGTYTFSPTNMFIQKGDFIGLADIGAGMVIGTQAAGRTTNDFTGHNQDMNGDSIRPTATEPNVGLLVLVNLKPTTPTTVSSPPPPPTKSKRPPPPKKKNKRCKCANIAVSIDPTLFNKARLPADKQDFGVGFSWRMTCSAGNAGGCKGKVKFSPPKVLASNLPPLPKRLKLKITSKTFKCQGPCQTSTQGSFQIKMLSRGQLNTLFGRTLAFSIKTTCSGVTKTILVNVFVDSKGILRPHP